MLTFLSRAAARLTGAVEEAQTLDAVAGPLATAASTVIPRGPVNDLLSGTPAGHPLHPALVMVPLGSWLSATTLDVLGGREGRAAARRLLGVGSLAAVPAALAGVNDWMDTRGPEQRVGLVHALLNVGGLGLFTASWWVRGRGHHGVGVALSSTGMALAAAGGWLGGHLAYARGVGVDTTVFQSAVQEWTDVGTEDLVREDMPILVRAHGIPVMLVRDGSTIVALADRCTHRGAPLHEGTLDDGCVTCPWHGSRFRLADGAVMHGPATRPQPRFEVRVHNGRLEVRQAGELPSLRTNPVS
ncbi:Rieske 2Fe-2S domain-containing protein [Ornithinimicrobium avium]|uniref:DUF2231 domain-containing protein n=1 Tax=Ornithinimicrobium avium TaxID=2283195 RepID=A0A345NN56_9MICO|nr:Rieske 2Fe-2S domain-containing protein [Ornithinimicrobium avium]AXH96464.1 DUF2231 domain-containing protein [Ornithinimicrobium avium]